MLNKTISPVLKIVIDSNQIECSNTCEWCFGDTCEIYGRLEYNKTNHRRLRHQKCVTDEVLDSD